MSITTTMLKEFRRDLNTALLPLQQKYGMALSTGRIGYTANSFHVKVEGAVTTTEDLNSGLSAHDLKYKAALLREGAFYGVENCFGRVITVQGKNFALTGINPKASKNIFTVHEIKTGKSFVIPESYASRFKTSSIVFNFETRKTETV